MANDGFIEFLSGDALSEMDKAIAKLDVMATKVKEVNTAIKGVNTPSGADNSIKAMNASYREQANALKLAKQESDNYYNSIIKANQAKKSDIALSNAQTAASNKATAEANKQALANERLNSAYNRLNSARTEAKNRLRDLIASENASNAALRKAQKEFEVLDQKVRKADRAVGDFSKSVGNYKSALSGVGNLMGAFGIGAGLYLAADIAKNIYQTTKQLQSMDLALKMVSGTQEEFANNQVFLKILAEQYGIEIKGLTKNFTEFWVASKGKLEAEEIKQIFTSISKSVAVMGLSVEQQDSAFLALQQMMSKGTVQAEELKKQLGNALPGAVKAATMAYQALHPELKVTEKMFMEQMKAGKVLSAELLPELAKAYEKLYGIENVKRAETLAASQERLANSWTDLVRAMDAADTSTFWGTQLVGFMNNAKTTLEFLTKILSNVNQINAAAGVEGQAFSSEVLTRRPIAKELKEKGLTGREEQKKYLKEQMLIYYEDWKYQVEQFNELVAEYNSKNQISRNFAYGLRSEMQSKEKNLEYQKSMYEAYRAFLKNIDKEKTKATASGIGKGKSEKQINIQDKLLQKDYDTAIRMLEIAKKFQEEIFNDEEKTYAERLAAREVYSKISLDLIDAQNNREIAIEKDKAAQLLKNQSEARNKDLKANAENVKNGFADKRVEIENRYAENVKTINYNLNQGLYKIDLDYLEKTHELQNQDLEFFKGIQKEKEKLSKETADIYFEMAQEKRLKDSNDENRSLTQRQASFESWKEMAEAQLFFDEALAKSESNQSPEQLAKITAEFDKLRNSINDTVSPLQKFAEETKGWLDNFSSSFASDAGFSETFKILEDDFFKNIEKAFDEGLMTQQEKYAAYFNGITEMAQEAYNFLSQMSERNFDAEYERLEKQRDIALAFAGDSASAREEIERQYEQRRRGIARREAKAKQQQAIFNIVVDTAQAIVSSVAASPLTGGMPFAAIAAAIGAAQIAMVASQQIPQYWKGTDNAEGGLAWTQEKGREIITDSQGRVKSTGSDGGAQLTMLSKGDKVFTAEKSAMMFNDSLNGILTGNNISMPKIEVSMDAEKITNEIKSLANTIANKPSFTLVKDAKGERVYMRKQAEIKEMQNARLNIKGYDI